MYSMRSDENQFFDQIISGYIHLPWSGELIIHNNSDHHGILSGVRPNRVTLTIPEASGNHRVNSTLLF